MADVDWNFQLAGQLDWHWREQLRPRLDGMTDAEYRWEPVSGAWNVRPRGTGSAPISVGAGEFTMDFAIPEPVPPPVTTIAWRLGHIIVGVLGMRVASHFGGPPVDYSTHRYPGDAATALDQLDEAYAAWITGVRGLGADGLARACGPAEGPWATASMAELVLHINREMLHHGAEVALLRDLYRWRDNDAVRA
jgi:DinB superfamily